MAVKKDILDSQAIKMMFKELKTAKNPEVELELSLLMSSLFENF